MSQDMEERSAQLKRGMIQRLESLHRAGVTHLGRIPIAPPPAENAPRQSANSVKQHAAKDQTDRPAPAKANAPGKEHAEPKAAAAAPPLTLFSGALADGTGLPREERVAQLAIVQREVAKCTRCDVLAATRTQTVFGVGNPEARLCFLGEAPGADEDRQGEPFVGRAGQLLTRIIEACTLKREDVYILNVLKCRPPDNRNPTREEATNCRGFLDRQLEIIKPEYICCLGSVAAQALLDTTAPIGRLRGKFHDYEGIPVLCTYHPAYLLRNPSAKRQVWDDMKILMRQMGVELDQK